MGRPTVQFSDTVVPVRSSGDSRHDDGDELLPVCDQLDEDMIDIEEETEDEEDEEDDDDMCEEIARQSEIISARDYQVVPCVSSVYLIPDFETLNMISLRNMCPKTILEKTFQSPFIPNIYSLACLKMLETVNTTQKNIIIKAVNID